MSDYFISRNGFILSLCLVIAVASGIPAQLLAEEPVPSKGQTLPPSTVASSVEEARVRARLLYRALSGALQVMHRDLFNEERSLRIPSRSLEDVFAVLVEDDQVKLRWIAVNAPPMNVDHAPADDFERKAAKAIIAGQAEFEFAENGVYRYVGTIRLANQCLKCHIPNRKSLEDRFAGLVISLPYQAAQPADHQ